MIKFLQKNYFLCLSFYFFGLSKNEGGLITLGFFFFFSLSRRCLWEFVIFITYQHVNNIYMPMEEGMRRRRRCRNGSFPLCFSLFISPTIPSPSPPFAYFFSSSKILPRYILFRHSQK